MAASALMEGSKKAHYSSYGDQVGAFKDDFTEATKMVHFVREKLQDQNQGFLKRWFYTLHIPIMERWKKSG